MQDGITSERRFLLVAGEVSGDQHGASLIAAMRSLHPDLRFAGIGGTRMHEQGMKCIYRAEEMALVGFWEVLRRIPFLLRVMRRTIRFVLEWQPERVIVIDYPGFNLRLARQLHRRGIPVTYYISPQLWAWRENRIATIREHVDQLLVIFPFEVEWYRERGVSAQFVGHPLLDEPDPEVSREDFLRSFNLDPEKPVLTLYPGSRPQELDRHLQIFYKAARLLMERIPGLQVMLGLAQGLSEEMIPAGAQNVIIVGNDPRLTLRYCDAAIVASGTATLEGTIWGVPMAVVYRVAPFSWWLGRRLVKLPFVSMANILSGEQVVPEFLQERAHPTLIAKAIFDFLMDNDYRQSVLAKMVDVRKSLLPPGNGDTASSSNGEQGGASLRAAKAILESGKHGTR
ncbi:lipid-A-disaccharide synthase [Candidatus Neomarinimicrobiota bacterium]